MCLPTYYIKSLEYYYNIKGAYNQKANIYKEHFIQSIAGMRFVSQLKKPSDETMGKAVKNCSVMGSNSQSYGRTLVLDLDETLVHVSRDIEDANFLIPIKMKDGSLIKVSNLC